MLPLLQFQNDEESGENEDAPPENYELEAELRPSASLLTRNVPREVCQTRFLRSHHTTSSTLSLFLNGIVIDFLLQVSEIEMMLEDSMKFALQ